MIERFKHKGLKQLFQYGEVQGISPELLEKLENILIVLNRARRPEDMNLPGFRFHALVGRDKGRYAVNASGNWRITFGWLEGDAIDVDLEDYH